MDSWEDLLLAAFYDGVFSALGRPVVTSPKDNRATFIAEDRAWLESNENHHAFSFVAICEYFHQDPNVVRERIRCLPELPTQTDWAKLSGRYPRCG